MADVHKPVAAFLRRRWRWLRSLAGGRQVDFIYSRKYQMELPGIPHDTLRAERILTFLSEERLLSRRGVHSPYPASLKWLRRVHTEAYLESVHDPEVLVRVLGFRISDSQVDRMLELQRSMVGGTLLATRRALALGSISVNLGGGLHHAFADHGERFCVFNDVATAIHRERARGFDARVLVVDLDVHDSDGIRTLFARDPTVHTYSIHNLTTAPVEAEEATVLELTGEVDDATYLATLRETLPPVFERVDPDLVIYLAGVDAAEDDEIGDWKLTAQGILARDRFVADLVRGGPEPRALVVVLGGGYGPRAWRYSARFFAYLAAGDQAPEPPSTEEVTLARYRSLARLLGPAELTGEGEEEGWGITLDDIYGALGSAARRTRLLGYYSAHGVELALERAGILERLRNLGFEHPRLELDLDNPSGETVRLFGDAARRELLFEMRARRDRRAAPGFEVLRIEWLLMQNPRAEFTAGRPPLPGQQHPGLGMLQDACAFLVLACERLGLDGILFVPSHFHLAAQSRSLLRFLEPDDEARFRALYEAVEGVPLAAATRAVDEGRVVDGRTGKPVTWQPRPMVLPVSAGFKEQVMGEAYEAEVAAARQRFELRLERPQS